MRPPILPSILSLSLLVLLSLAAPAEAQEEEGLRADLKIGAEVDTNATRDEGAQTSLDVLTRYFLKLESAQAVGDGQGLDLKFRSGGKLYRRFEQEDALLNQGDVRYFLQPLAAWEQRWIFVTTAASLKDSTEEGRLRDYLRASAGAGLGLSLGPLTLTAGAGAALFVFKPDRRLSNSGPTSELGAQLRLSEAWALRAGVNLQEKRYPSSRFVARETTGEIVRDELTLRLDKVQSVSAGLAWRGPVVASLDLSWLDNASNSDGQSVERTGAALTITAPLPWSVLVSATASLQQTAYGDEIFIDETLAVDEDNRNSLVVEVERPISERVGVALRYALYGQEFGAASADYGRQLFFLGLGVEY